MSKLAWFKYKSVLGIDPKEYRGILRADSLAVHLNNDQGTVEIGFGTFKALMAEAGYALDRIEGTD